MKTIKFLFLLIILGLLGLLIYQNIDYFNTTRSLALDLKFNQWQWTAPPLPNWAFWGICFGLGLLITGLKGLVTAFGLGREIKKKDAEITELSTRNRDLQARLDVFIHDPYIKKGLSEKSSEKHPRPAESSDESGEKHSAAPGTSDADTPGDKGSESKDFQKQDADPTSPLAQDGSETRNHDKTLPKE